MVRLSLDYLTPVVFSLEWGFLALGCAGERHSRSLPFILLRAATSLSMESHLKLEAHYILVSHEGKGENISQRMRKTSLSHCGMMISYDYQTLFSCFYRLYMVCGLASQKPIPYANPLYYSQNSKSLQAQMRTTHVAMTLQLVRRHQQYQTRKQTSKKRRCVFSNEFAGTLPHPSFEHRRTLTLLQEALRHALAGRHTAIMSTQPRVDFVDRLDS